MKNKTTKRSRLTKRELFTTLSVSCMIIGLCILVSGLLIARAETDTPSATPNVHRVADSNTTDAYVDRLISSEWGSRYAGRLWSDKSVLSNGNTLTLDMQTDGYSGSVSANADFLHVFSALGSSQLQNIKGVPGVDLSMGIDITSSMISEPANYTDSYTATSGTGGNPSEHVFTPIPDRADRYKVGEQDSRISTTLQAANNLIKSVRDYSDDSRSCVVVNWGTAYKMLPLTDAFFRFDSYDVVTNWCSTK